MPLMGELTFFLGLQIKQTRDGIFLSQTKYALELLKKFDMQDCKSISTPMASALSIDKDETGIEVDGVILRVLFQDVLSGSSSHARFRLRGVLVIARGGYLSGFGPKNLHFQLVFLSLKLKDRNLSSLPILLNSLSLFSSSKNPPNLVQDFIACLELWRT